MRKLNWFFRLVIAAGLAGALVLTGYFLVRSPQDLHVISLNIATVKELPAGEYPGALRQPEVLVAVVHFGSRTDLRAFASGFPYGKLYAQAKTCKDDSPFARGNNLVYDAAGPLGFEPRSTVRSSARGYHLYFQLRPRDNPNLDLISMPEDVCIFLTPDAYEFGFGPSTNTMRISGADLAKAITHSTRWATSPSNRTTGPAYSNGFATPKPSTAVR